MVRKPITKANLPDWSERHLKLELLSPEFKCRLDDLGIKWCLDPADKSYVKF